MARAFCIPGVIFILCAFVLSLLVSISLPYLTALDIVRTHYNTNDAAISTGGNGTETISQLRLGIWAYCTEDTGSGDRTCTHTGYAYPISVHSTESSSSITIGSAWTRGLAVHPVATAVTLLALLFSFSTHITLTLFASLLSFLAATLTLIAFIIDIALLAYTKSEMRKLSGISVSTDAAPGFWMTFVALILLLLGGCTVCFGRRRDRMAGATIASTYPTKRSGFFGRFRRN